MAIRAVLVVYDVPSGTKLKVNPPQVFRRVGFRINLSCWVVAEPKLIHVEKYIGYLREQGATVRFVRFDKDEDKEILALAREELERDLGGIRATLEEKLTRANEALAKAEKLQDVDATNKALGYVRTSLRAAKKHLADANEASVAFDLFADMAELFKVTNKVIAAQQELYFAEHAKEAGNVAKKARPRRKAKAVAK